MGQTDRWTDEQIVALLNAPLHTYIHT